MEVAEERVRDQAGVSEAEAVVEEEEEAPVTNQEEEALMTFVSELQLGLPPSATEHRQRPLCELLVRMQESGLPIGQILENATSRPSAEMLTALAEAFETSTGVAPPEVAPENTTAPVEETDDALGATGGVEPTQTTTTASTEAPARVPTVVQYSDDTGRRWEQSAIQMGNEGATRRRANREANRERLERQEVERRRAAAGVIPGTHRSDPAMLRELEGDIGAATLIHGVIRRAGETYEEVAARMDASEFTRHRRVIERRARREFERIESLSDTQARAVILSAALSERRALLEAAEQEFHVPEESWDVAHIASDEEEDWVG